jgi:hypothetical protein
MSLGQVPAPALSKPPELEQGQAVAAAHLLVVTDLQLGPAGLAQFAVRAPGS